MNVAIRISTSFIFLTISANGGFLEENEEYLRFTPNFLLGAATSAYQIEGAWNVSDKGESTWDRFTHQRDGRIHDNDTGDVACDFYHKYKEDIAILKEIGLNSYRLSLSWPRILPTGFDNKVSVDGINYYKNVINELVANGIEPMVTLYHWDHPQVIEDMGGWLNPQIVDWFGNYARIVFKELGEKVKRYITINEPTVFCTFVYEKGAHAPGKKLSGIGEYLCGQNILKAHARAYRIYEKEFKETQKGEVGFNANVNGLYPKHEGDTVSAQVAFEFHYGFILHPIYSEKGDYPEIVKTMVARESREEGFSYSRLPELGSEWIEYIRGASDFLTVNHYTSFLVEPGSSVNIPSFTNDQGVVLSQNSSWKSGASTWLKKYPEGLGDILRQLAQKYGNPVMYITENGFSDRDGTNDTERIDYFCAYMKEMLIAINRDGVNVKGYFLWSFLDSFEWTAGYSERFGIVHVDFKDPERRRTLKKSAYWWKRVLKNRKLECSLNEEILERHIQKFSKNDINFYKTK